MKRVRITKILYWSLVGILYVLATVSYMMAGYPWYDAAYCAVGMFSMGASSIEKGNLLFYVVRVICPVMTVTGLIAIMRNFFKDISDAFISGMKNATAIYYDAEETKTVEKHFLRPVMMKNKVNKKVNAHVLLFEKDIDNLNFYKQMENKIKKDSKVYIKLEEMESGLLKNSNVYYFNINEIIAREYWQKRNLMDQLTDKKMNMKIAIIGFDALGKTMLNYGLMNNIYSLEQSIQYHVWGENHLYKNLLGKFDMMNQDSITYHNGDWRDEIELLKEFDRVIVTQENNIELLQALLYLNSDTKIDFYNPKGITLAEVYRSDKLTDFGVLQEVITEDNIKTDKLYREAKEVNYNYVVKYDETGEYTWERSDVEEVMELKWKELNGFIQGSNVACADYHKIRLLVMERLGININGISAAEEQMLAEMEHVRWSRYHYVNHWHYASIRNDNKRLHHLLVPYSSLSSTEQKKDIDAVKEMFCERMK